MKKLKERPKLLDKIYNTIEDNSCDIRKVLAELEYIVKSRIKLVVVGESAYDEERKRHNSDKLVIVRMRRMMIVIRISG